MHKNADSSGARTRLLIEAGWLFLSLAVAGLVVAAAAHITLGELPKQNTFFQADTERVLSNLTGTADSYYRLKVHPLIGWEFVIFQFVLRGLLHLPIAWAMLAITASIALATAALFYLVLRRMGATPASAFAFTAVFCCTGSFVAWSTVPESHLAGGASVLLAALLLLPGSGETEPSRMRSALAFTASFSMVVTNAAAWLLAQLEFETLDLRHLGLPHLKLWAARQWRRLRSSLPALAIGIGAMLALWAAQWPFLRKRLGIPFNFLEEHHYIKVSASSPLWTLDTFGYLFPGGLSAVMGACATAITAASLIVLPRQFWFIPLFALFGVALHSLYGSDSAFLFSGNYAPMSLVAIAAAAHRLAPRWAWAGALVIAAALAACNIPALELKFRAMAAAGQIIAM